MERLAVVFDSCKGKYVSIENLSKIQELFPIINMRWLLTGSGNIEVTEDSEALLKENNELRIKNDTLTELLKEFKK